MMKFFKRIWDNLTFENAGGHFPKPENLKNEIPGYVPLINIEVNTDKELHSAVLHPPHYTNSEVTCPHCCQPIECWDVTENFNGNLSNVIKYVWRCDLKDHPLLNLEKAKAYLEHEIARRKRLKK